MYTTAPREDFLTMRVQTNLFHTYYRRYYDLQDRITRLLPSHYWDNSKYHVTWNRSTSLLRAAVESYYNVKSSVDRPRWMVPALAILGEMVDKSIINREAYSIFSFNWRQHEREFIALLDEHWKAAHQTTAPQHIPVATVVPYTAKDAPKDIAKDTPKDTSKQTYGESSRSVSSGWTWDPTRLKYYYWSGLKRCWIYQDGEELMPGPSPYRPPALEYHTWPVVVGAGVPVSTGVEEGEEEKEEEEDEEEEEEEEGEDVGDKTEEENKTKDIRITAEFMAKFDEMYISTKNTERSVKNAGKRLDVLEYRQRKKPVARRR